MRRYVAHLRLLVSIVAAVAATTPQPLHAQANWPARTVTIIVPNAAGGFTDIMARLAAQHFSKKFGQAFIIENRAGGAGVIGAMQVANAQPDGYTFLFTSPSTIVTQPLLQKVSYDPDSFAPISILGNLPFLLGIRSALPPRTLQELVAYAKARPGKLNYASAGVGRHRPPGRYIVSQDRGSRRRACAVQERRARDCRAAGGRGRHVFRRIAGIDPARVG
jgi:tripartite-type tricarboxylate transporter receptor subunit TctC